VKNLTFQRAIFQGQISWEKKMSLSEPMGGTGKSGKGEKETMAL
jgi:hypothetical protein